MKLTLDRIRAVLVQSPFLLCAVFLLLRLIGDAEGCPTDCHCFSDPLKQTHQKVSCHWSNLDANLFAAMNAEHTLTLSVSCNPKHRTQFTVGMFAKFSKLRSLKLSNCLGHPNVLSPGVLDGLSELRSLKLEADNPGAMPPLEIQPDSLKTLSLLENLQITGHRLQSIPAKELCDLTELKMLNLSHNQIDSLANTGLLSCAAGSNLVILDLSNNQLRKLDVKSLSSLLRNLHILHLKRNQITTIDAGKFELPAFAAAATTTSNAGLARTKLQELYLQGNRISELSEQFHADLPLLKILDLSENQFRKVPPALTKCSSLQRLNLSRNFIDSLGIEDRIVSASLEYLDLSFNVLQQIPSPMLANATSLKHLFASNNLIEDVASDAFKDLGQLQSLDLSSNNFIQLNKQAFNDLTSLQTLDLHNNSVLRIADDFFTAMTRLSFVQLSENLLSEVPTALTVLYYLNELDLSNNRIQNVHKFIFDKLPNLQRLSLADNKLAAVERYVFENIPKLESLNLSNNEIERLSTSCFDRCHSLKALYLQHNLLRETQGAFSNLNKLKLLNLTHNQLTHVDMAMLPASLGQLAASHNKIQKFTNFFQKSNLVLEAIDLSHNQLSLLTNDMLPSSVHSANFSYNQIREVEAKTFLGKANLSVVDLRENRIQLLNQSSVALDSNAASNHLLRGSQPQILLLYLSSNPLLCSCKNDWIKAGENSFAAPSNLPVIADYSQLTCSPLFTSPSPVSSDSEKSSATPVSVQALAKTDFLCTYDIICTEQCRCCDFTGCDCKQVCPDGCSCFNDNTLSVNIVQCSRTIAEPLKPSQIPMDATKIYLDGNDTPVLPKNAFLGRYRLRELYLNNSRLHSIDAKAFSGLTSLQLLDLSDNELKELRGDEFSNMPELSVLRLNGNRIRRFTEDSLKNLPGLQSLTLSDNRLETLPQAVIERSDSLSSLTISGNPWKCDCNDRYKLQSWLPSHAMLVKDSLSVYCFENLTDANANSSTILSILPATADNTVKLNVWTFIKQYNSTFCAGSPSILIDSADQSDSAELTTSLPVDLELADFGNILYAVLGSLAIIFGICVVAIIVLFLQRRKTIDNGSYREQFSIAGSQCAHSPPIPPTYADAFLTYSIQDSEFVMQHLAPLLEDQPPYYQLCLLHRDLSTSAYSNYHVIQDELISKMENSQCIIMLVTEHFLANEWELAANIRTAHQCVLRNKQPKKLIVIVKGSIQLEHIHDKVLGCILRTSQHIHWDIDPMRVDKLRDSMPEKPIQLLNNNLLGSLNRTNSTDLVYGTIVPSDFV